MASPPNFDRMARPYRWLEYLSFGPLLSRCRCARLEEFSDARRALVLGDGDGRFLARFLRANPDVQADAVDASPAMLRLLRRRARRAGAATRLTTHCLRAEDDPFSHVPPGGYDLVVSHFFLDCLQPEALNRLAGRVAAGCRGGARWVISEFAIPASGEAPWLVRQAARALVAALYSGFALLTGLEVRRLPDHAAALRRHGFRLESERCFLGGVLRNQVWRLQATPPPPPGL